MPGCKAQEIWLTKDMNMEHSNRQHQLLQLGLMTHTRGSRTEKLTSKGTQSMFQGLQQPLCQRRAIGSLQTRAPQRMGRTARQSPQKCLRKEYCSSNGAVLGQVQNWLQLTLSWPDLACICQAFLRQQACLRRSISGGL